MRYQGIDSPRCVRPQDDEEELVEEEETEVPSSGKRNIMPIEMFWPVKPDDHS